MVKVQVAVVAMLEEVMVQDVMVYMVEAHMGWRRGQLCTRSSTCSWFTSAGATVAAAAFGADAMAAIDVDGRQENIVMS
jgi:hypothetical protein